MVNTLLISFFFCKDTRKYRDTQTIYYLYEVKTYAQDIYRQNR